MPRVRFEGGPYADQYRDVHEGNQVRVERMVAGRREHGYYGAIGRIEEHYPHAHIWTWSGWKEGSVYQ